ncbi:hypothetical protein EV198_0559 [Roseivirga ehrenbergii]|uniref:Uncharacterized protein n=1 Tax=Roseivirga ehrenbergii (strain DSM 102268 / JCM 13514 / KCTC 12282 / NCIMB 14502 / KMM 6017) TaxID=279360 RepID=A0A150X8B4_ROSEK|nr:hypothetical protein [Roseivirga ehrenbergii]KYG74930.1 hypothetical protein MB14_06930 [Roseivirga ehrenbergii]TCL13729.1 hypothetical protein EV198_0559 [Roseivirga ehrenbergii]
MKKTNLFFAAILAFFAQTALAQDNNDTNIASHQLDVNVPEVALLDIFDANTGFEAGTIIADMTNITLVGANAEAGLYAFEAISYENLYLNYTSVTGASGSGFDVTRQIDVQFEPGSTFPASLDLRITPEAPVIVANGGSADSAGSVTAGGVALGATTPIGTDALLVSSIESVYTGDENYGVKLSYTLEQSGNFSSYEAGLYQATIRYTLSDL